MSVMSHKPEEAGGMFLRNISCQLPNYTVQNPKELHPHYKDRFVTKRSPLALHYLLWVSGNFPATLDVSFVTVFFLFLACYTSDKNYSCCYLRVT
jgi:hypothetical protein